MSSVFSFWHSVYAGSDAAPTEVPCHNATCYIEPSWMWWGQSMRNNGSVMGTRRVDEMTFFSSACFQNISLCTWEFCVSCLTCLFFRLWRLLFDSDGICGLGRGMQLKYAISIFFTYFHFSPFPPKVSFAAHIAGGFAGMSIGYTVFSCFDKALLKDPRFWIAIAAYFACVLFAVFFNVFLSPANWVPHNTNQVLQRTIWEKTEVYEETKKFWQMLTVS